MLTALSFDSYISLSNFIHTVNNFFNLFYKKMKTPLVKSSATSSLITRVPEVKLFGLAQTKYLRFYTCEVV